MKWGRYTVIFIAATFLSIIVYDTLAIMGGGTEASISHVINVWSYKYPAFTFAMGFVMGHLFWRTRPTKELDALSKPQMSVDISEHLKKEDSSGGA